MIRWLFTTPKSEVFLYLDLTDLETKNIHNSNNVLFCFTGS
jgi:hypothetical protein